MFGFIAAEAGAFIAITKLAAAIVELKMFIAFILLVITALLVVVES